jgi:hypothetical protein
MTIIHSDQSVEVTPKSLMFLVKLNQLTDAELSHHFPKLDHLTRDEKIKFIVFSLKSKIK